MKPLFGLLALLTLALAPAHAEYFAYFEPGTATLSASGEFPGHFGNYTLMLQQGDSGARVAVSGQGEGSLSLAMELSWLEQNGVLSEKCGITHMPVNGSSFYCSENGSWSSQGKEIADAPGQQAAAGGEPEATSAPQPEYPVEAPAPLGAGNDLGINKMAYSKGAGEAEPTASGQAGMLGAETVLQMLAAFLAVIIASYLILQSRHEPGIDAQAERLLENPTRAGIMEELSSADKIPTDLSTRLGKSKASVVEHLSTLLEAGLVERIATPGKKFVYYRLTQKGRQMLLRRAG